MKPIQAEVVRAEPAEEEGGWVKSGAARTAAASYARARELAGLDAKESEDAATAQSPDDDAEAAWRDSLEYALTRAEQASRKREGVVPPGVAAKREYVFPYVGRLAAAERRADVARKLLQRLRERLAAATRRASVLRLKERPAAGSRDAAFLAALRNASEEVDASARRVKAAKAGTAREARQAARSRLRAVVRLVQFRRVRREAVRHAARVAGDLRARVKHVKSVLQREESRAARIGRDAAAQQERRLVRENARLRAGRGREEREEEAAPATGATGPAVGGSAMPVSDDELQAELERAEQQPEAAQEGRGDGEQQPVALPGAEETAGELDRAQQRTDEDAGKPTGTGPFCLPDISYVPDPRKQESPKPAHKQQKKPQQPRRKSPCPERCGDVVDCPCSPEPASTGACGEDRSAAACIHPAPTGGVTGATAAYAWPDITGSAGGTVVSEPGPRAAPEGA